MANVRFRRSGAGAFLLLSFLAVAAGNAAAHERRQVGDYSLLVGWMSEPAYEGHKNGVDFRVNTGSADGDPVEGLAETVQVEVIHEPTDSARTLELRGLFNQPGRYTADLIPTAPGAFRFRFFGTIEGTEVDEVFDPYSLGGGFNDVASSADIQFPEALPETRELVSAIRGLQAAAPGADDAAIEVSERVSGAYTIAIVALVVAILGSVASLFFALRKR